MKKTKKDEQEDRIRAIFGGEEWGRRRRAFPPSSSSSNPISSYRAR